MVAELRAAGKPLWEAVAVLVAAQHLSLRVRQLCPGGGPALRVSFSATLQPAFFTPEALPVVAAARAALLDSLRPDRQGPPAQGQRRARPGSACVRRPGQRRRLAGR